MNKSERQDPSEMVDVQQIYNVHDLWKYLIPNTCMWQQILDPTKMTGMPQWYEGHSHWKKFLYLILVHARCEDTSDLSKSGM